MAAGCRTSAQPARFQDAQLRHDDLRRPLYAASVGGVDDVLGPCRRGARRRRCRRDAGAPRRSLCRRGGDVSGAGSGASSESAFEFDVLEFHKRNNRTNARAPSAADGLGFLRGQPVQRVDRRLHRTGGLSRQGGRGVARERPAGRRDAGRRGAERIGASALDRRDRPALLRQHRLCGPVGFLLRLAAPLPRERPSRPVPDAADPEDRRTGRHALSFRRRQGRGPAVLRDRPRSGDNPHAGGAGAGLSHDPVLRLQAGGDESRRRRERSHGVDGLGNDAIGHRG